jgi:hypothetical protein
MKFIANRALLSPQNLFSGSEVTEKTGLSDDNRQMQHLSGPVLLLSTLILLSISPEAKRDVLLASHLHNSSA